MIEARVCRHLTLLSASLQIRIDAVLKSMEIAHTITSISSLSFGFGNRSSFGNRGSFWVGDWDSDGSSHESKEGESDLHIGKSLGCL